MACPEMMAVTQSLQMRCAVLKRDWDRLWLLSPHQVGDGASTALCLRQLELTFSDEDLRALLPAWPQDTGHKRLLEFLGGRLCAERALFLLTGVSVGVPRAANGEPVWPPGLSGAISHTDAAAYAVVAPRPGGYGIGIDSEALIASCDLADVAALSCTEYERRTWLTPENALLATVIFSAKEAVYKALYGRVLRFIAFDEFEVETLDLYEGCLRLHPMCNVSGWDWLRAVDVHICLELGAWCGVHTTVCALLRSGESVDYGMA